MSSVTPLAQIGLRTEGGLWRGSFVAMANPCEVLSDIADEATARRICETAAQEAWRIERKFSRYRTDSVVYGINTSRGRPLTLDAETADLIDFGATLWELSERAFDLTSGVLRHVWRFEPRAAPPAADRIAEILRRVGWQRVRWQRPQLTLPDGMEIDFGGIGKEYAVDRAVAAIQSWTDAPVLVNFGGDLRVTAPPRREAAWQIGIESVATFGRADRVVKLSVGALATSGDTRRCMQLEGRRYGHIIDARTGWPAPDAPRSVTVAADTCSQAGVYTTLAMLQGKDAEDFLQGEGVKFWCLR